MQNVLMQQLDKVPLYTSRYNNLWMNKYVCVYNKLDMIFAHDMKCNSLSI